ncbi:hypothetical protein FTUN_5442 [Frigoriglobus tundricola]|uniref:Uncharacterized protein n=1 Tax=Frigoriglobus tundricola TaxID=2774151 RepID=A0A6M5YY67_9BACT|nr:hypothetical protein FTUN_5442 [Frigoriglobus tundricola]
MQGCDFDDGRSPLRTETPSGYNSGRCTVRFVDASGAAREG